MKLDKYKLITAGLVGIAACSGIMMMSAYADTPASSSSSANASITVSNTINLTLTGGDLVIDNLTPGNASDSNTITATITSNSPYGYHLSATTGTSSGTTSLVNTADSNFSFANLSTNKATLNDFSDNTWGYSYSTNNGTTWISGDYGSALAGYNGLTLDNDDSGATGTTLYNNDSYAGSTAVKFKIGAKSATTQAAGTYRPRHSGKAYQTDGGKRCRTHNRRNAFPQINLEDDFPGAKPHRLRSFNHTTADFRQSRFHLTGKERYDTTNQRNNGSLHSNTSAYHHSGHGQKQCQQDDKGHGTEGIDGFIHHLIDCMAFQNAAWFRDNQHNTKDNAQYKRNTARNPHHDKGIDDCLIKLRQFLHQIRKYGIKQLHL